MSPDLVLIRRIEPTEFEFYLARAQGGDQIQGPAVVDQNGKRLGQLVVRLKEVSQEIS